MNDYQAERRDAHERRAQAMNYEVSIALLNERIERMDAHLEAQDKKIFALEHERDRALRWGIGALGAIVLTMGAFIVSFVRDFVSGHVK